MGRRRKKGRKAQVIDLQDVPTDMPRDRTETDMPRDRTETDMPQDRTGTDMEPIFIPNFALKTISNYVDLNETLPYVFLTISEYPFSDINPYHVPQIGSPTHILFFCLRLINCNVFTPICVVLTNRVADNQPEKLVVVWKSIIQDLSIFGLQVICSVSPSKPMFHTALEQLTMNPTLEDHTGPITYSSYPYKNIIHLYCYNDLMHSFQDVLSARKELYYVAYEGPNKKTFNQFCASWSDLVSVMNLSVIDCKYTSESGIGPYFSIFTRAFNNKCINYFDRKLIQCSTVDSTRHLMQLIGDFTDIIRRSIRLTSIDIQYLYNSTENFRMLLATGRFASISSKSCSDDIEFDKLLINEEFDQSSSRTTSIESLPLAAANNKVKVDHFDEFIDKVCYDKHETLVKTWSFMDTVINADLNRRCMQSTSDSEDEIDYETYKKKLEQQISNHDNTPQYRSIFNDLYDNLPTKTEKLRITNDWLCTLKGYVMLTERLEEHYIQSIYANSFCLDHVDFYVYLLRKYKSNIIHAHYDGEHYEFFDTDSAFLLLEHEYGICMLTQD